MARAPLRPPRATRAQLDAAAAAGTLVPWEVFQIADEGRLAFATAANAYEVVPRKGDVDAKANASQVGTMAARSFTISTSAPSGGVDGDVWAVVA